MDSTKTHQLRKPKGTVLGSRSEGDPAVGHLGFPSLGGMSETWRERGLLLVMF